MSNNPKLKAGVVGWPIAHSLSPRLHGYWLKQYRIDGAYDAYPVEPASLGKFLKMLPEQGLCGVNLTVPHKELAVMMVDEIEPLAKRVGAVNTIIMQSNGKLQGRNTDVFGFAENLRVAGFKPDDRVAILLGAGGAARAGLVALMDMGITDIRILNRTQERAQRLAEEFSTPNIRITAPSWNGDALESAGLLVNATSLGMKNEPLLELSLDALPSDAWVTDMVYAPLKTDLLKRAGSRGNKTVDGLGMLLHQARPAFAAFFGIDPSVSTDLREHVLGGS